MSSSVESVTAVSVGLLTGGDDRSYVLGLTAALVAHGVAVDCIGSDRVDAPELHNSPKINFLNLRGDQNESASLLRKMMRILVYYVRLLKYAVVAKPRVFHILWNNKFEWFDRTLLLAFYRLMGRRIVLTAHNVNTAKRDGCDSAWNRLTLLVQYSLADHIFVHTKRMRDELLSDFDVPEGKTSIIPFGINNTTPTTTLTREGARARLGLQPANRTLLFFGQIAPYKGLNYLVQALPQIVQRDENVRLVIAGKVKSGCDDYWRDIQAKLAVPDLKGRAIAHIQHIPDSEVEVFFKASDVLVIPYVDIFQSGVPFLAYSFGLPVVATDVGALREDIIEGKTGFICAPCNPEALTEAVEKFFASELYRDSAVQREAIRAFANHKHSWLTVGSITQGVYQQFETRT